MAALNQPTRSQFVLPTLVTSPGDVNRLLRELELIDNALLQSGVRTGSIQLPEVSRLMNQTVELNKLNLLQPEHRSGLKKYLERIRQKAPVMHMSFSADPPAAFIEKLMAWLRREIHPQLLLTIGLQPTIGAGCIVRTTNKYFDFSLREDLSKKRDVLQAKLAEVTRAPA